MFDREAPFPSRSVYPSTVRLCLGPTQFRVSIVTGATDQVQTDKLTRITRGTSGILMKNEMNMKFALLTKKNNISEDAMGYLPAVCM